MNVEFYTAHVKTLKDLQEIAEKHNCTINFGFRNSSQPDIDLDIIKTCGATKKQIDLIEKETFNMSDFDTREDTLWFELYDKNTNRYHTMRYNEFSCTFWWDNTDYDKMERTDEENEIYDSIEEDFGFSDLDDGDKHYFSFSTAPTYITGFGYEGRHQDGRVYRSGMALKFFGDLVCDYLKEPRIERTY